MLSPTPTAMPMPISADAYTHHPEYSKLENTGAYPRLTEELQKQLKAYKRRIKNRNSNAVIDEHGRFQYLIETLGKLSRLIYDHEKELQQSQNPPAKDSFNVFVFEHTADFHLVPAYKTSSTHQPNESLNFIFRPNLNDQNTKDSAPVTPLFASTKFKSTDKTWLIGYDIETQSFNDSASFDIKKGYTVSKPSETVSHQWYFNFQGVRFGIVLLTPKRFTQDQFITYLDLTVPVTGTYSDYENMRRIFVYSYFSVYESGWLKVSYRNETSEFTFKNRQKLPIQVIMERNDEWFGYTPLRKVHLEKPGKDGRPGVAKEFKVQLIFADAIKLQSGGLKKLGELIGINKRELEPGIIEHMANYLQTHPRTFNDYAITDSVIAAEAHLYIYHTQLEIVGVKEEKTRMPGYSVAYFKNLYMSRYPDPNKGNKKSKTDNYWKTYLGYTDGKMSVLCKAFIRFYYGGRNDVVSVGPRDAAYYLDLHSAYLTSMVMLKDYNFSKATVYNGTKADRRARELFELSKSESSDGPFQVIGIECSFVFKREHTSVITDGTSGKTITVTRPVKPIFPIRIDESAELPNARVDFDTDGIIYPRSGASCITWPEFWVAMNLDLLEHVYVFKLTEFEKVTDESGTPTNWLADDVLSLLIARKTASDIKNEANVLFYKNFLNFFYGKVTQGIQETASALKNHDLDRQISTSAMTCFPIASYICGFCRSVVSELLQLNDCYGITTDGYITPTPRDQLITGDLCNRVQKRLKTGKDGGFGDKKFIGCDYVANKSLFLKTRGYMFIDTNKPTKEDDREFSPKSMLQKIAKMGAQLKELEIDDPTKTFLEYLQNGYSDKKYFVKLTKIRKEQITTNTATPEMRKATDTAITMTYDMKHVPVDPKLKYFDWYGVYYPFVSFETVPLETAADFHILRMMIDRDYSDDLVAYADPGVPDLIFPIGNAETEYDKMLNHWKNTAIDIDDTRPFPYKIVKGKVVRTVVECPSNKSKTTTLFKFKQDKKRLTEVLLKLRAVPKYLELDDYKRLLAEFEKYKAGE